MLDQKYCPVESYILLHSILNFFPHSAWISEMMALITSDDPPHDVASAEALLNRHMEHKAEIDGRADGLVQFTQTGLVLIKEGHFLSDEVRYILT